jgi:DNA-binding MarR family transcriptional regulator
MADEVMNEITRNCLLTRTRQIARVITNIYDEELRPFGINSPQFSLLVVILRLGSSSRAQIGRANHQERSTLTRNLQLMLSAGWVKEVTNVEGRRGRSVVVTNAGKDLLHEARPAWRKAQKLAKGLLGKDGVTAVTNIADGL